MMKKIINVLLMLVCLITMNLVFADFELTDENKYGLEVQYSTNSAYPGEISIDGVYVYQTETEYVFTIKYSNGELVKFNDKGNPKAKTSFFNPPSGDIIKLSWMGNYDKVTESKNLIQYHVDKDSFSMVNEITVFLFDILHDNSEDNISVYFYTNRIIIDKVPHVDSLISGYEISNDNLESNLDTIPSSWAAKNIEELQLEGIFKDESFSQFSEGITRERFVYLMVKLYEELTGRAILIDNSISFDDSGDEYVLKAATIGLTSGIGDNKFGPDVILNREQMTTFIIKTLNIAKIDTATSEVVELFNDDEEISDWAKDSIYTARTNGIMGGLGDNLFSPKSEATNEQALYITHDLMEKYGDLEWLKEYDGKRVYLKFEDDLYQIPFEDNILVSETNDETNLFFISLDDIDTFMNLLFLKAKDVSYIKSSNPNFKGIIEEHDYNIMKVTAQNIYSGVDKTGEKTTFTFDNNYYISEVTYGLNNENARHSNFDSVKYYNLNNERQIIETLPINKITEALGIEYKVSFDEKWEIYVIEVISQ